MSASELESSSDEDSSSELESESSELSPSEPESESELESELFICASRSTSVTGIPGGRSPRCSNTPRPRFWWAGQSACARRHQCSMIAHHFDILLLVFVDVFDVHALWIFSRSPEKFGIGCSEFREERLYA